MSIYIKVLTKTFFLWFFKVFAGLSKSEISKKSLNNKTKHLVFLTPFLNFNYSDFRVFAQTRNTPNFLLYSFDTKIFEFGEYTYIVSMAIWVVEFSNGVYKIRKIFA
jgi:hypothetical protein